MLQMKVSFILGFTNSILHSKTGEYQFFYTSTNNKYYQTKFLTMKNEKKT